MRLTDLMSLSPLSFMNNNIVRKKILWLSHLVPYPPKGGVQQRSYNLIKEVAKYHDVTLLAFNQKAIISDNHTLAEAKRHFSHFCERVDFFSIVSDASRFQKLLLLAKGLITTSSYNMAWLKSEEYSLAVSKALGGMKYDVIHVDTISLAYHLPTDNKVPVVLNHHNIESTMLQRRSENEKNLLKKLYFFQEYKKLEKSEKKICKKVSLNVTCSDLDSQRLQKIVGEANCLAVPNGVDLHYFNTLDTQRKKGHLIFAGGLSWYPNADAMRYFIEKIWPLLMERIPRVHMTIIGKNPPDWLTTYAAKYENLRVTGFVDDVRPYLSEAYIYVCPIRDGGGTKLKVLDALAMGIPLVADPIACEGIDVSDGETVLLAETPMDYVDKIDLLLSDDTLCQTLSHNSRELIISKYSFESLGKKLSKAYVELSR